MCFENKAGFQKAEAICFGVLEAVLSFLREAFAIHNAVLCLCTNAYTIAGKFLSTFEPYFDMHKTMYENEERGTQEVMFEATFIVFSSVYRYSAVFI